jgi:hypothetical protein
VEQDAAIYITPMTRMHFLDQSDWWLLLIEAKHPKKQLSWLRTACL